jgi:hypothetical protein
MRDARATHKHPHKVTRTYFARFWPPLWHSSGYRAIAGYGWERKLCSLFFSLFFQADTPKTCAWRENNLPCLFAAGLPVHFLKPLLPRRPARQSCFCLAKKGAGKAHALTPDRTGVPCSWQMVVRVGFEPTYATRADLQSAAFNHSATSPDCLFA